VSCKNPHGRRSKNGGDQTKYTNKVFVGRLKGYVNRMEIY
jgi:hypothetical protein